MTTRLIPKPFWTFNGCLSVLLVAVSAFALEDDLAAGTQVIATPTGVSWEECTVIEPMPGARAYYLDCTSGDYTVGVANVQARTEESVRLTLPPSAKPGMPQVGDAVLASPLSREDGFETCRVIQDLTAQGAYGVDCPSGEWVVGIRWVKPAPAVLAAPSPSPPAPPAPAPPAPPPPAPPPPTAPRPPEATVPAATVSGEPIKAKRHQRDIPSGIYLAPVGGAIEVLQIRGGLIALNPRRLLTEATFAPANATLVGTLTIEDDQLIASWSDGSNRTGSFEINGNCLIWNYIYCEAEPFERGVRLIGTYVGSATAGGGAVSRTASLTFFADGSYEFSATGAIGAPAGTSGAVASGRSERGRFGIDGWTLRLKPEMGEDREYLSFPYEVYAPLDPIYLDGGFMRMQQ
ncbi:MAG: hypothetical protein ACO3Z6_09825 [Pseudomonadales bacterium]